MLTRLRVRNFKMLEELDIELGDRVVFIGPNNSGKTTAMQALALWELGMRRWNGRRDEGDAAANQPGVAINRRDATAIPGRTTDQLWRNRIVVESSGELREDELSNVPIEIIVNGRTMDEDWECGLSFEYANPESMYCRPLSGREMPVAARPVRVAMLPPMSGLIDEEVLVQPGAVNARLGEGRTAEVLRNLCLDLFQQYPERWTEVSERIRQLFGDSLQTPSYLPDRGSISMTYDRNGVNYDLTASGRGMLQTLLLLVYMHANSNCVLLLDEPDAHLETLRQREMYDVLADAAARNGNQIIIASHSEVLLNQSARSDSVVAFVGRPHRINGKTQQAAKALNEIGWDQYAQAMQTGWVLYVEGPSDLLMLRAFATRIGHERAMRALQRPFVREVGNVVNQARTHFYGLREAVPQLQALALFDRLGDDPPPFKHATVQMWRRNEIENYICTQAALEAFALADFAGGEIGETADLGRVRTMRDAIQAIGLSLDRLAGDPRLSRDVKGSETVLEPIFRGYFDALGIYNRMAKRNFHELVQYMPIEEIDPEVTEKLDAIADVAESATPASL